MRRKKNIMKLWQTSSAHCMMWFFHCPCHPLFWHVFILYQDTLKKYEMQSLFSMTCVLLCSFRVLALIKDEYKLTRYNLCSIKSHYTRIRNISVPYTANMYRILSNRLSTLIRNEIVLNKFLSRLWLCLESNVSFFSMVFS